MTSQTLPHDNVHVRLGVSPIHGIGVFAIHEIDSGVSLFGPETESMRPVPAGLVDSLPPGPRRLYTDFCVPINGSYFAPESFNHLTVAWYLNHGESPNVACCNEGGFVTLRTIRAGEELTMDYRTFHPGPLPWLAA